MPRRERLDFREAIHYAVVRGAAGAEIFFNARDLQRSPRAPRQFPSHVSKFGRLLAESRDECGALLHAYCIEPNTSILVLKAAGAPLRAFMQRLCGAYARNLHRSGLALGHVVFASRYDSKIIAPEYLPHAVRRAHWSPIESGLCKQPVDYPFSSDRAYRGETAILPIDMADVRAALALKGHFGARGYRNFMNQAETSYVRNLLSHGSPLDSRIVGDKVFVQTARQAAEHPPVPPGREQLIAGVASLLRCTSADIFSPTRTGTLGRALVAWYGVRSGAATLTEIGQWFSVTGATLGQAIRRHQSALPDLFGQHGMPSDSI
jgi:putative transposase